MTIILSLLFILLAIYKKDSKIISVILLLILIIMFGWSSQMADTSIYIDRLEHYNNKSNMTYNEPLFTLIMKFFNNLGFSFESFKIFISIFCLLTMYIIIRKSISNINYVLLLYFIFPFCMDVVQIRYTMAITFIYIGIFFLLNETKKTKALSLYILFNIIAGLIHYSTFLYLAIIIPAFLIDYKKCNKYIIIILIIEIAIISSASLSQLFGNTMMASKIERVLRFSSIKYNMGTYIYRGIQIIISLIVYYYLNRKVNKKFKENKVDENKVEKNNFILNINKFILIVLPLLMFSVDFYRIQTGLLILNYISFSWYFNKKEIKTKYTININELSFHLISLILPVINLYMLVLNSSNTINVVLVPLFKYNILLS